MAFRLFKIRAARPRKANLLPYPLSSFLFFHRIHQFGYHQIACVGFAGAGGEGQNVVGQVQRFPVVQRIARGCLCQNLREGRIIRVRLDAVPVIRRTAHPGADNAVGQGSVGQREINVRISWSFQP